MLQFFKFNKENIEEAQFSVISGHDSFKFFIKRIGYVLFFLYSTVFIAAIDPFINSSFELWVFYIGAFITGVIILRFCNHVLKFIKYNEGKISLDSETVKINFKNESIIIAGNNINNIEVNILGNILFREENKTTSFPLMLLSEDDRIELLSLFKDISENRTKFFKKIWDFFDALLVAFILAMHIREYIIQAYFIPTGSMEDTLLVGDHLLVEKITYGPVIPKMLGMEKEIHLNFLGISEIKRGNIVIFKPPNEKKKDYIKRCIALPGDNVNIKNGSLYVNGKKVDEPYTKGFTSYDGFREKKIEGVVPQGKVVVFGDNRENSYDSRGFGYLAIERIKGKAFILYWNTKQIKNFNFSRFGLIE